MELSAPGVGDTRKLAWALLRGHALPTGVLVEPLGTDTARLTLRGHLREGGQWLLGVAPLAATTALGPSEAALPTAFFPDPSLRAPCSGPFSYQSCPAPPLGAGLLWPLPKWQGPHSGLKEPTEKRAQWPGRQSHASWGGWDGVWPAIPEGSVGILSWTKKLRTSTVGMSAPGRPWLPQVVGPAVQGVPLPLTPPSLTQGVPVASI